MHILPQFRGSPQILFFFCCFEDLKFLSSLPLLLLLLLLLLNGQMMECGKLCEQKGEKYVKKIWRRLLPFQWIYSVLLSCVCLNVKCMCGSVFSQLSMFLPISILCRSVPFFRWNAFYVAHQSFTCIFFFVFSQHKRWDPLLWFDFVRHLHLWPRPTHRPYRTTTECASTFYFYLFTLNPFGFPGNITMNSVFI